MTLYRLVVTSSLSRLSAGQSSGPDLLYWDEGIVSASSNRSIYAMSAHPILEGQYLPRVRLFAG